MTPQDDEQVTAAITWRKSTRSDSGPGQCVEVGSMGIGVAVRDSKNHGPRLETQRNDWESILTAIKRGGLTG